MRVPFAALVFAASGLGIGYVLAGYPLLLALLARLRPRPARKGGRLATVSVVIAVRNGERWLARKLESVLAMDYPRDMLDVLVVSDGSTDRTEEIARGYADRGVRVMTVPAGGKPAALNAGVPNVRGELVFLTDVRQTLDRNCLRELVARMADPEVGVVSGNLLIAGGATEEERSTGLYWRYENWIRRNLSLVDSMLGATGPVYLIRASLFTPIPPDILLDDVYLPLSIHVRGYRLVIAEKAIAIDEPTALKSEFRRKVRTQAGVLQMLWAFPDLFRARNRMRFHWISLKLGRLALPYMLAAALVSALMLPGPWAAMAAGPQIAFWLAALADPVVPAGALKKITSGARAFAVLVSSAAFALKVLFVPPRKLWVEARESRDVLASR